MRSNVPTKEERHEIKTSSPLAHGILNLVTLPNHAHAAVVSQDIGVSVPLLGGTPPAQILRTS